MFCVLPSSLEKDVLSNSEDLFCSKHLVSFLVILTGGITFLCEVRLSFKYSNEWLTNTILSEVWWTAPSPKLKQRSTQEKRKKPVQKHQHITKPHVLRFLKLLIYRCPHHFEEVNIISISPFSEIPLSEFCSLSAPSELGGQPILKKKRMLSMNWTVLHPVTNIWQHQSPSLVDLGQL